MTGFLEVLPLVVVMIAGPQLLSAVFLATSERWRRNSAAYVTGAGLSISLVTFVAYVVSGGAIGGGTRSSTVYVVILVLLVLAMVHTYRTREQAEPPKWMGKLLSASPRFSFRLGFLLLGFFPTDLLTSAPVGSYLAAREASWTDALPFVGLTLLALALPALVVLAFGDRAERFLPKVRRWMETNSWVVNEFVLLLFVGMTLNNLVG